MQLDETGQTTNQTPEINDMDLLTTVAETIITNTTTIETTVKRIQGLVSDAGKAAEALMDFGSLFIELYAKAKEVLLHGGSSRALTPRQAEQVAQVVSHYRAIHPQPEKPFLPQQN